jgi:signal transduction histidine kinase
MAAEVDGHTRGVADRRRVSRWPSLRVLREAASLLSRGPLPTPGVGRLRFSRDEVIESDPTIRALLGSAARRGAPTHALREALASFGPEFVDQIERLMRRGESFRTQVGIPDRGVFDVAGAPSGADCAITFIDVTAHATALAKSEAAASAARAEAEAARGALDACGAAVWRVDVADRVQWRSTGASQTGDPMALEAPVRFPLPEGGALIAARGQPPAAPAGALNRFVETVTETFAHLRIGLAIFDKERRLTLANPAVAEIFGMGADFLSGRPTLRQTLDRLREARQLPEQLDYPAWRAALFTLFDNSGKAHYDERWELPDGRSVHVVGRPHPSGGIAFIFEDVTEAINAQRWRLTAVEVRRAMLDALVDGVIAFGPDGKTRLANPALMRIWRLGDDMESAPRHVADFADACRPLIADVPIWDIVRDAVSGAAGERERRWRVRLTDGRILLARVAQLPDGSTLAAFSDVTDSEHVADALRARAETLKAADQMRNAMLYQISHGLRTPLNAVIGFAELLAEGHVGPVPMPQASYLDNIRAASTAMLQGVESLSDLVGRGGAPSVAEEMEEIQIGPVLRGAIELLEPRTAEHEVMIIVSAAAESAVGRGDPPRVRQMIYAALTEAVAFAAEGAALTVDAALYDGSLAISISGATLPEDETKAFAVARRTAEMHNAVLRIERDGNSSTRVICAIAAARP